jgi:uncharacterized Fe-S radical SAM superfamily protein PflX
MVRNIVRRSEFIERSVEQDQDLEKESKIHDFYEQLKNAGINITSVDGLPANFITNSFNHCIVYVDSLSPIVWNSNCFKLSVDVLSLRAAIDDSNYSPEEKQEIFMMLDQYLIGANRLLDFTNKQTDTNKKKWGTKK